MPCVKVYVSRTKPQQPQQPEQHKAGNEIQIPRIPTEYLELGAAVGLIGLLGWYLSSRR